MAAATSTVIRGTIAILFTAKTTGSCLCRFARLRGGCVRYRFADEAKWPAQLQDVKTAIRWLRGNAQQYGIDPQRVAVWGESSGGHIAAMVGATCGIKEFDKQVINGIYGNPSQVMQDAFDNQSSCVQVAVLWHATTDMARLDAQSESFARLVHNTPVSSQSRFWDAVWAPLAMPPRCKGPMRCITSRKAARTRQYFSFSWQRR